MSSTNRIDAIEYAQGRANQTRRAYVVSAYLVLVDCPHSRRAIRECEDEIIAVVRPS